MNPPGKKAPLAKGKAKGKEKTKTLGKIKVSELVKNAAPKNQLVQRNVLFELKFSSSAIFVSDAVASNLLTLLGVKQYGRFLSVSSDLWESEVSWRTILMAVDHHLPEGGRVKDMLAKHAPTLAQDAHPRCGVQFCLGLKMLCVDCEVKLWEGYFKLTKIPDSIYCYYKKSEQRVCKDCHTKAFAAIVELEYEPFKACETHMTAYEARSLYNVYAKDIKTNKITSTGATFGLPVAELRIGAIDKAGGDILALTMALEGCKVATEARKEEFVMLKRDQATERSDRIDAWLKAHPQRRLLVAHVDESIWKAYTTKTLGFFLESDDTADPFDLLTSGLSEIAFFLTVNTPGFRTKAKKVMWRNADRFDALYALYKTKSRPVQGGPPDATVKELVLVKQEHTEQCPSLLQIAILANKDSEETRLLLSYRTENADALADMAFMEAWTDIRRHVEENMASFEDPNLKKAAKRSSSSSSSSGSKSKASSKPSSKSKSTSSRKSAAARAAEEEEDDDSDDSDY